MAYGDNPTAEQAPLPFAWGVLYAKPNPDDTPKMCGNCIMWSFRDQKCSIHKASLEVLYDAICGYHVFGKPMENRPEHPGMDPVDPGLSGFDIVPGGTYCGSCIYYEDHGEGKGVCHGVAKTNGVPPQPVDFMGCCARWEGDA